MASIHQKSKNGTWYISYRQHGELKHRSLGTKNAREARRIQKEIELRLQCDPGVGLFVSEFPNAEQKNPTAEEFWQAFVGWAMHHRSPKTVDEYKNWYMQFLKFSAIERLGDVKPATILSFLDSLCKQGKRKPQGVGLAKVSMNSATRSLGAIWNHASRLGLYSGDNPFSGIERYRIAQKHDREYLNEADVSALLDAASAYIACPGVNPTEAQNVKLAIALMALAGLRKKEVCYSRWEWIDWKRNLLTVSCHDEFVTKNKRSRTISMHLALVDILKPFRKPDGYILAGTRPSLKRCHYRADFRYAFNRVCEISGVKTNPHALRHSFASRHAVAGTSLHVIAGWLGHSSTAVTERYAHFQTGYNDAANNI